MATQAPRRGAHPDRGRASRRRGGRPGAAGAVALALVLAACGAGSDDGADVALPPPAPAPPDAPGPDPGPEADPAADAAQDADPAAHPFDLTNPDLGWPFEDDVERVLGLADAMNAAFDSGNAAGFAFVAERSWPDGFTAAALLACRLDEPTPTWADLDGMGHRLRFTIVAPLPAPYFVYPPTGELPFDSGLRVYVALYRAETIVDGEVVNTFEDPARVAIRPDGAAVMFPTCFEYLPGQLLAHRVTDGDVGGYTDAEAAGDVRLLMTNSPREAQLEVCGLLDDGDLATIAEMVLPADIEAAGLRIPAPVLEDVLTDLCAGLLA